MAGKVYGWNGWKLPIFNLDDPDYCEFGCPVCTGARRGSRWAKLVQSMEIRITGGGCPWGKARERKYGVRPDKVVPPPKTG
jgi:hypothetical protein